MSSGLGDGNSKRPRRIVKPSRELSRSDIEIISYCLFEYENLIKDGASADIYRKLKPKLGMIKSKIERILL